MRKSVYFFVICLTFFAPVAFGQTGKDGAKIISAANVAVNEYTSLTTDAVAGNTFIKVSNSTLNTNNRFANSLNTGDLVMIIQMLGATINGTANDSTWGTVTNYNNCGLYEFSEVAGVPDGTTINLNCSLKNNYTASGKVQVVRVPRFLSLTINTNDSLTCDPWSGASGGIIAVEVNGNMVINTGGTVNASAKGFRGGTLFNTADVIFGVIAPFTSMSTDSGGMKGESIAGYKTDYNAYGGMYCRGAPANGGGGGNDHNTAGGGGGNAGAISSWTGNGTPSLSNGAWAAAWNLEYNGFATSASSGGGRGGYAASASTLNPYTVAPGNSSWGYDSRDNTGGKGGRPLDYSGGRIFLGGGGGAGHENDNAGGAGSNGGGLVFILSYGTVSGGGIIVSNGASGGNTASPYGNDGAGGGGAGGTIIISTTDSVAGISIYANGGNGGNQYITSSEAEGPGGGGGGGYIAISRGTVTQQANGGANGTTNSSAMTAFTPNGATQGGVGFTNQPIGLIPFSTVTAQAGPGVTICAGQTTSLSASGGATYSWSPSDSLSCDTCADPVANPVATTTYVVTVTSGSCSGIDSVVVTVSNIVSAGTIMAPDSVCYGEAVQLGLSGSSGPLQWQYSFSGNNFVTIPGADSVSYSLQPLQTTYFRVLADSASCADTSLTFIITINPLPAPPVLSIADSVFCAPDSALITTSGSYALYSWNTGDTSNEIYASVSGEYWLTVADANGCTAVSGRQGITVNPVPVAPELHVIDSIFCASDSSKITTTGTYTSYLWNDGDTTSYTYATVAGGYWVTVSNAQGCYAVSGHKNVSIYPVPSVSIVVQGDTLASLNASSYQWYYDDTIIHGATSPVYVAKKTGNYAVQITDSNGCKTTSNNTYITIMGITTLSENGLFGIYPDPFVNAIFIKNNADDRIERISLYDATGRLVETEDIKAMSSGSQTIEVSNLPSGTYYLSIRSGKVNYTQPVIKR